MRNGWVMRTASSVLCAALLTACGGGSDGANDDRRAQAPERRPEQAPQPAQPQPAEPAAAEPAAAALVALSGCLEAAPGTNRYVLRNVRFEPRAGGDPHRTTTTTGPHGITEGAWVRL